MAFHVIHLVCPPADCHSAVPADTLRPLEHPGVRPASQVGLLDCPLTPTDQTPRRRLLHRAQHGDRTHHCGQITALATHAGRTSPLPFLVHATVPPCKQEVARNYFRFSDMQASKENKLLLMDRLIKNCNQSAFDRAKEVCSGGSIVRVVAC